MISPVGFIFSSVQSLSCAQLFATPWTPGFLVNHQLLELAQTRIHRVSDAIQPSHPLLPPSLPVLNLPQHQGLFQWGGSSFTSGGQSIRASASVLLMNIWGWIPLGLTGLISFLSRGLPTSLLQHHNSKASVLWCSAFFLVHLSHPYMTTRKAIALAITDLC